MFKLNRSVSSDAISTSFQPKQNPKGNSSSESLVRERRAAKKQTDGLKHRFNRKRDEYALTEDPNYQEVRVPLRERQTPGLAAARPKSILKQVSVSTGDKMASSSQSVQISPSVTVCVSPTQYNGRFMTILLRAIKRTEKRVSSSKSADELSIRDSLNRLCEHLSTAADRFEHARPALASRLRQAAHPSGLWMLAQPGTRTGLAEALRTLMEDIRGV